jgi:hypothetical protein
MGRLADVVKDPARKHAVVLDAAELVESEVASKRGLRGAALKAGFGAFKKVRPGIVPAAVDRLLPHFVPVIDPLWDEATASGDAHQWFRTHDARVASALLGVTDGLAERARNKVVLRIYRSLRGSAEEHVRQGAVRIPELIERHIS